MNAQQRAANAAAGILRSRAAAEAARGVTFNELGVRVKGNEVFNLNYLLRKELRYLGPLAGASAGFMDVKPASGGAVLSSIVIGNVPRVGTIFVAFANGKLHKRPLLQGSPRQMRNVDAEVARFNAMVDVADASAKEIDPSVQRSSGHDIGSRGILGQTRVERVSDGLSYRECKPGRDAYKAARRAGLSREEASKASRDALKRVKEAKLVPAPISGRAEPAKEPGFPGAGRAMPRGARSPGAYEHAYAEVTQAVLSSLAAVDSTTSACTFVTQTVDKVRETSASVPEFYPAEFLNMFKDAAVAHAMEELAQCRRTIEEAKAEADAATVELQARLDAARNEGDRKAEHAVWREREARQAAFQAKIDAATAQMAPIGLRLGAIESLVTAFGINSE